MNHPALGMCLQRADLAKATGCNLETIRYYEKTGLLAEPLRSAKGYRLYGEKDVRRLRFIMRARALGFTIEEIRGLLTLVDGGTQTCVEVKARTALHLAAVRAKLEELRRRETTLAQTAPQCSGDAVPPYAVP